MAAGTLRTLVFTLCVASSCAVNAQTPLATYAGADRMQRLVDGARKEGEVVIYTSAPLEDIKALTDVFERKYGVTARIWRASSEKVLQRTLAEIRGGRIEVDVVETNGPELEALVREGALQKVASPSHAELIAQAVPPHSSWIGTRLNIFVIAYNTRLVRREDLPDRWEAFAHPRWKGRLGIEADDADWFSGVAAELGGEANATRVFRDIVQANGISVRKGHTLLAQLVASGEVPLAFTVYNYKAEQLKGRGAPIDWFVIGAAIARANGVAVVAKPKNPHAALLFHEFEVSAEGQRILLERDFVPTHRSIGAGLNSFPLRFVDSKAALNEYPKWRRLYDDTFAPRGR